MPEKLRRYLQTHDFLDRALREHGPQLSSYDATNLRNERDATFLKLLSHVSADPRVTMAQFDCVLTALTQLARNSSKAEVLRVACLDIARRLVSEPKARASRPPAKALPAAPPRVPDGKLGPQALALLDAMSDRVGIYDSDYRFVFTNAANAAFHGLRPADFVGRPSWSVVGEKCFARFTKPAVDRVLAGRSISSIAKQGAGAAQRTYSVTLDPVRGLVDGRDCVLVIARDVTALGLSTDIVVPLPDE